jgi:hypothetical protein
MLHAGNQDRKPSVWSHQPVLTPERKLWRAVLMQAYDDAELANPELVGSEGIDNFESVERLRARAYLRADTRHQAANLRLVCEFADLPADRIYLWARRKYPLAA